MNTYTVKLVNQWTNKSKMKTVKADSAWQAERAARSNYMMANCFCAEIVEVL